MCKNIEQVLSEKGCCVISTKGDSMWPVIKSGRDKVLIVLPGSLSKNDIVLYRKHNTLILHRIVEICNNYVITRGDNYTATEKVFKEEIIGKVDGIYGKKNFHSCNSPHIKSKYFARKIASPIINLYRKGRKQNG